MREGRLRSGCRLRCGEPPVSCGRCSRERDRPGLTRLPCFQVSAVAVARKGRSCRQWKSDSNPSILLAINRQRDCCRGGICMFAKPGSLETFLETRRLRTLRDGGRECGHRPALETWFLYFPARTFSKKWPCRLAPVQGPGRRCWLGPGHTVPLLGPIFEFKESI